MMDRWIVELTARPEGRARFSVDDADELLGWLERFEPVIELGPRALIVSLTVEAFDVSEAVMRAYHAAREALVRAELDPDVPIVLATAAPEDAIDDAAEESPRELVGVSEIAGLLGVTPQRVSQIADHPWFPAPLADLAAGPVWDRAQVEAAMSERDRTPGRPKKVRARADTR